MFGLFGKSKKLSGLFVSAVVATAVFGGASSSMASVFVDYDASTKVISVTDTTGANYLGVTTSSVGASDSVVIGLVERARITDSAEALGCSVSDLLITVSCDVEDDEEYGLKINAIGGDDILRVSDTEDLFEPSNVSLDCGKGTDSLYIWNKRKTTSYSISKNCEEISYDRSFEF